MTRNHSVVAIQVCKCFILASSVGLQSLGMTTQVTMTLFTQSCRQLKEACACWKMEGQPQMKRLRNFRPGGVVLTCVHAYQPLDNRFSNVNIRFYIFTHV
jgi:hypothetical protein